MQSHQQNRRPGYPGRRLYASPARRSFMRRIILQPVKERNGSGGAILALTIQPGQRSQRSSGCGVLSFAPSLAYDLVGLRSCRNTTALLRFSSRAAYTSVTTRCVRASARRHLSSDGLWRSSRRYRRINSVHFSGSCPNHRRSSVLGATAFNQSLIWARCLETPRGQIRSTSTLHPSSRVAGS